MRRTPLASRTELRAKKVMVRHGSLRRTAAIRPANPTRKARLHALHFGEDDAYADWLRTQPCVCCDRWERDRMHLHHVKSRGAGGTVRDLVPLMHDCHDAGHVGGWRTFEERRGVNLRMEADALWLRWRAFLGGRYGIPAE